MHRTLKLSLLAATLLVISGCITGERYHQDLTDNMKSCPTKVMVTFSRTHGNAKITQVEREVAFNGTVTYPVSYVEDGKAAEAVYDEKGQLAK